jgi:hypothetical protein
MITYNWNKEKNLLLKRERNFSFEQIVSHIIPFPIKNQKVRTEIAI